jgi:fructose-1,6-bisphosphatase/inositol monophosphatase family enzyme
VAAGKLLVEEAGGIVTTYGGDPYTFSHRSCIASNGQPGLHRSLVENLQAARRTLTNRLFDE